MFSVAIDGPAGAGKSSIARFVARRFKIFHLDTGALYRALGYFYIKKTEELKKTIDWEKELKICGLKLVNEDAKQKIFVRGEEVSGLIRTEEVSKAASFVSCNFKVREHILRLEREFAKKNSVVMDGRDIGTVVLPFANLKIFLTASLKVRASRRFNELVERGFDVKFEEVLEDIKIRDENDRRREIAPLKVAKDAVIVDTSNLSLEESIKKVVELIEKMIVGEQIDFS